MTEPGESGAGREKRRHKRGWKTYRVKYGIERPEHAAPARRVSVHGLFIATNNRVFAPGVQLLLELEVNGRIYRAVGVVRHSLRTDARFARVMKPGMGIEFVRVEKGLKEAVIAGG